MPYLQVPLKKAVKRHDRYLHQDLAELRHQRYHYRCCSWCFRQRVQQLEKDIEKGLDRELEAIPESEDILHKYTDALDEMMCLTDRQCSL